MKKSIFGFLILSCCLIQTAFAQEVTPIAAKKAYLLAPGDLVKAKVLGEPQFDFEAIVDESGNIEVPFLNEPIPAMCKSERDVKADLTKALSRYLRTPQLTFQVTDRKSRPPVVVSGEVRNPQTVILMRETRLLEVLSFVGSTTEDASGMVQVFRPQAPVCGSADDIAQWQAEKVDNLSSRMYSMSRIKLGGLGNPVIYAGDVIVVQRANPVYFTGEVKSAQGIRLPEGGITLTQAIAMIGGVSREAKTKDIKIYRLKQDSKDREIISTNYDLIKKGQAKDPMLEPYDIVEVDKAKENIGQTLMKLVVGAGTQGVAAIATGGASRILY
jgi:protein involved in polysaccharide export with SLBB domain